MTRPTYMTDRDKAFMDLRDKVQDVIKTPEDWEAFKGYIDSYFSDLSDAYKVHVITKGFAILWENNDIWFYSNKTKEEVRSSIPSDIRVVSAQISYKLDKENNA